MEYLAVGLGFSVLAMAAFGLIVSVALQVIVIPVWDHMLFKDENV